MDTINRAANQAGGRTRSGFAFILVSMLHNWAFLSFNLERHLLQLFTPNRLVSPQIIMGNLFNTPYSPGGGTDFFRAHAGTADPLVTAHPFVPPS